MTSYDQVRRAAVLDQARAALTRVEAADIEALTERDLAEWVGLLTQTTRGLLALTGREGSRPSCCCDREGGLW